MPITVSIETIKPLILDYMAAVVEGTNVITGHKCNKGHKCNNVWSQL